MSYFRGPKRRSSYEGFGVRYKKNVSKFCHGQELKSRRLISAQEFHTKSNKFKVGGSSPKCKVAI